MASTSSLVEVLTWASSQDGNQLKMAEEKLRQWEIEPGFYPALMEIVVTPGHPTPMRWQAVLYVKNGIDKYWRKMAPNAINEDDKKVIRSQLLLTYSESIQQIALQNAVLVGKIARFDVPRDWPELIPSLMQSVQSDNDLIQYRSLLMLHHTIKALASKRLTVDRRIFHEMVLQLLPFVYRIWNSNYINLSQQTVSGNESLLMVALEKSTLTLKVIRKSIIHGLKKPMENQETMIFLNNLLDHVKVSLNFRLQTPMSCRDACEKYIVLQMKILTDFLDMHPFSFVSIMKETLSLVCSTCFTDENTKLLFQRFVIFSLNLLKQILLCAEYRLPKNDKDPSDPFTIQANEIKREFFNAQTVTEICQRMIANFLPLSQEDLNLWDSDPEDYVGEDGGDSWRYSYRPCCESAFLTVLHEHRDVLSPVVVKLLHDHHRPSDPNNLPEILQKDAIYNAVGLAAFDLYDEVDFDQWLFTSLAEELKVKESNYRIVRRRAVWLLGQWTGVKLSPQLRPKLYNLLLPLLESNEDLVVRLAAAKALKVVIDDFEFSSDELQPFLATAFQQLFILLKEVQECDTKLSVLNVLSYLVERMGVAIRPFCSELVQYLPALWEVSQDHSMLRCSILTTLVFIVQGLGSLSTSLSPFLYPVIKFSTDLNEPSSVYLLEDGLELWLAVLHNSKTLTKDLMDIAENIPRILALGSENLRTVLYILQAYILLSPHDFITQAGQVINNTLQDQYGDLQDEGVLVILRLVELAHKVGPPDTPQLFRSLTLCSLRAIFAGEDYPLLMSLHLSIASRLLLACPNIFNHFLSLIAKEEGRTEADVAGKVLDVWLDKMSCVSQPDRKKLSSLALASLITTNSPVVMERIYGIFVNVVETLNDITKNDENTGTLIDTMIKTSEDLAAEGDDLEFETEHDTRRREANAADPVHTVNLRDFFQAQVTALAGQIGQTKYVEIMSNVDVETLDNMREFISV